MSTTAINISPGMTRWPAQVRRVRSAFTLTEVLISVALVLVIILGVNQVFSMTGRAVGAGQALSDITRTMRNVQSVMTEDLGNAEIDRAPFFYIDSGVSLGFRNKEDQARDIDFNINGTRAATEDAIRTIDRNGNGRESVSDASDFTPVSFMTVRTHRTDQMGFFTRSTGRRQTGNGNSFTSALSSSEQYVIYGYLLQPADTTTAITGAGRGLGPGSSGTVLKPINTTGADANPNNYYATS